MKASARTQRKATRQSSAARKATTAPRRAMTSKAARSSKAFTASKTTRRIDTKISRCESPLAPDSTREFKDEQAKIDEMWREASNAPKEVKPIDFAVWDAKIKDKKQLAAIKAEYESKSFPYKKTDYMSADAAASRINAAKQEVTFYNKVIKDFEIEIEQARVLSTRVPFLTAYQQLVQEIVPGMDAEFDRQLSAYHTFTPAETIRALDSFSTDAVTQALAASKLPNLPVEAINAISGTPVYQGIVSQYEEFVKDASKFGLKLASAKELFEDDAKAQGMTFIEDSVAHLEKLGVQFAEH